MRGMRAAAKSRRSVKGYGILASPADVGGAVNVCQSHFVLLVFLGRFPIRPVSRSAVPYGLASRTGQ